MRPPNTQGERTHLDHTDSTPLSTRDGRADPLTARERELADLIADGMSNEQIAERLVLTPGTVANHVAHIIDKMQVHSRVQVAVRVAVEKHRTDARDDPGTADGAARG